MFDEPSRCIWAEQLWHKLREQFPELKKLPEQARIVLGAYPSAGARGRSSKIRPGEISHQWSGNANEPIAIYVHPVYLDTPTNAAKAMLFAGTRDASGPRWGPKRAGLEKQDDGSITAEPGTQAKLDQILTDIGEPPAGFGMPFSVRNVDRARLRLYVCATNKCTATDSNGDALVHAKIRAASDTLNVTCQDCGNPYVKA